MVKKLIQLNLYNATRFSLLYSHAVTFFISDKVYSSLALLISITPVQKRKRYGINVFHIIELVDAQTAP